MNIPQSQIISAELLRTRSEQGDTLSETQISILEPHGTLELFHRYRSVILHPLWLRERTPLPDSLDPGTQQRLYEPTELPADTRIVKASLENRSEVVVALQFSDGHRCELALNEILAELGWYTSEQAPPPYSPWNSSLELFPMADWEALEEPSIMAGLLHGFFQHGFCVVNATPVQEGSIVGLASLFGHIRATNFGSVFDVKSEPNPVDLAYTPLGLSGHTDNPYRQPVPHVQLLHCLQNEVDGGLSTLVDGFAIAEHLTREAPDMARVLEETDVRFRFTSQDAILENHGPILERGADARMKQVRFSSRVDYVPPLDPDTLALYYAGRRRLFGLAHDPAYEISFRLNPGMLLIMNNHRLLHGRTAFNGSTGQRHLQGCYMDIDGYDSLYRTLRRDNASLVCPVGVRPR